MGRVLMADDDVALCELLQRHFALDGLDLHAVHRGDAVLDALRADPIDALILDVMLPGLGGLDVLKAVRREWPGLPVLILSARGEEFDRVLGLELGADDYLAKPFSQRELVARVRSLLRRAHAPAAAAEATVDAPAGPVGSASPRRICVDDLALDLAARQAWRDGQRVPLTGTEFSVLHVLLRAPGDVVDKPSLYRLALGRRMQAFDRTLDTHVSNLRHKLGPRPDGQPRIVCVRGAGYAYVLPGRG